MRVFFRLSHIPLLMLAFAICIGIPASSRAQSWQAYELRTVTFEIPENWTMTLRVRDEEYDFMSADKRVEIWVRWWFQDEPITGFSDEISNEIRHIAGQDVSVVKAGGGQNSMMVLFPREDPEGDKLLLNINGHGASFDELESWLAKILDRMTVNGIPAGQQKNRSASNRQSGSQTSSETAYYSSLGDFSVPLPAGWKAREQEDRQTPFVIATSPAGDAMVLAARTRAKGGQDAKAVIDHFMAYIYGDAIINQSIEGEERPRIAGQESHALEVTSKVYDLYRYAPPFKLARVIVYNGGTDRDAFLIITMRNEKTGQAFDGLLQQVALGFRHGRAPGTDTMTGNAATAGPDISNTGQNQVSSSDEKSSERPSAPSGADLIVGPGDDMDGPAGM